MSAFASLNALKPNVEQHLAQNRPLTASTSLEDLGGQQLDQKDIGEMTLAQADPQNNQYELKVTFSIQDIRNRTLSLYRNQGIWSCVTNLPDQFKPARCDGQL